MGCSNCSKQQVVVVQNISKPSFSTQKNDMNIGNVNIFCSSKIKKLDNGSKLTLSVNTPNSRSQRFSSSASRKTSNDSILIVKLNNAINKHENKSATPIKDFIDPITKLTPTRNISDTSCKRDSTISVNWLENVSDRKLKFFCFGENSENTILIISQMLCSRRIMNNCNNEICFKGENYLASCYKLTNEGLVLLKRLSKRIQDRNPTIEDANESRRLRSIITRIVVVNSKHNPLTNLKVIRPISQNIPSRFHLSFEKVEIIEKLENYDMKSTRLLILSFDYHSRSSFDLIIATLNFGLIDRNLRIIAIGLKQSLSTYFQDGTSITEKTFEVNEDFAKLAFHSLGIEYYTYSSRLLEESVIEVQLPRSKGNVDARHIANSDDKLIQALFNL